MRRKHGLLLLVFLIQTILLLTGTVAFAEEKEEKLNTILQPEMTLQQVAQKNNLPLEIILNNFANGSFAADTKVNDIMEKNGMSLEALQAEIHKLQVENKEHNSRDWKLIFVKFSLWGLYIITGMVLLVRTGKATKYRTFFLAGAVLIFGVLLGSDPNPVGTVKDALVLYGQEGVVFKPRIIALTVFLLTVLLASRMLCGWGCHFGSLQDLFYKLPTRKYHFPFIVSNTLRIAFFLTMTGLALGFGFDLVGQIDPFKIFSGKPLVYWGSTTMVVTILIFSVFIYRPWCTLFCPFGLLAWLLERFSLFKIRVSKENCLKCGSCSNVCPTGAAELRLRGVNVSDCFNCGECINVCPVDAIKYGVLKNAKNENISVVTR